MTAQQQRVTAAGVLASLVAITVYPLLWPVAVLLILMGVVGLAE